MKRRTRPASPRPSRPSTMERLLPGIDSMSDIEGCKMLIQLCCLAPPSERGLAYGFLGQFIAARGLEFRKTLDSYQGFDVMALSKDGEDLASFSVESR